jgi:hypothetical protein
VTLRLAECGKDGQGYSFGRDKQWFAEIAPALRFIAKMLVTVAGASAATYGVPAVSSAAASLLGSINKDALESVTSDLCADLSSDIRDGIDAVAERGGLPDLTADGHVERALGKSFRALREALNSLDRTGQRYGLEKCVADNGDAAWVLPEPDVKAKFVREGKAAFVFRMAS